MGLHARLVRLGNEPTAAPPGRDFVEPTPWERTNLIRPAGLDALYFVVEPRREALEEIGRLVDAGILDAVLDAVFPLADARAAFERLAQAGKRGKIVLEVADDET